VNATVIISDNDNHKVDVSFETQPDGVWVQITKFHKKSNTEWITTVIKLSPATAMQLASLIQTHVSEEVTFTPPGSDDTPEGVLFG
jgi:hypothetical protein